MKKALVRVEARRLSFNADRREKDRNLVQLLRTLKKLCQSYGIPRALKEHEFYVKNSEKQRRKREQKKKAAREGRKDELQDTVNPWEGGNRWEK